MIQPIIKIHLASVKPVIPQSIAKTVLILLHAIPAFLVLTVHLNLINVSVLAVNIQKLVDGVVTVVQLFIVKHVVMVLLVIPV